MNHPKAQIFKELVIGTPDSGSYIHIDHLGRMKMYGKARTWDDMQSGINNVKLPASSAPTWRYYNFGIGSGVTYPVLGFYVDEYIYFDVQTSHSMELNSILDNHIHWTIPTDDSAKYIKFQLDVIGAGITEAFAVPTGSPFTKETVLGANRAGYHSLLDIADIPAINTTVSSAYKCRLMRVDVDSGDEYGSEVYIIFDDSHYIKDRTGSREEGAK